MGRSRRSKNKYKNKQRQEEVEYLESLLKISKAEKKEARQQRQLEKTKGKNKIMKEEITIAVYDDFRKSGKWHLNFSDAEYIGSFDSDPVYNLYSFGNNSFAGIKENGATSIKMEVYKIDKLTFAKVKGMNGTMFSEKVIDTPYSKATVFVLDKQPLEKKSLKTGDWLDYKMLEKIS